MASELVGTKRDRASNRQHRAAYAPWPKPQKTFAVINPHSSGGRPAGLRMSIAQKLAEVSAL